MLNVSGLSSGYGEAQVLHDVSFNVEAGEIICLLGRNGAGKSTCLKTIMGLIRTTSGRVECGGVEVSRLPADAVPRHGIGYIPQGRRLFSELTVAENLEIGLMVSREGHTFREQVLEVFPRLRERLHQRADTLSGGEQQRVALARASAPRPAILLADEPTGNLDSVNGAAIMDMLFDLRQKHGATLVLVTHADDLAARCDRVITLTDGRIV